MLTAFHLEQRGIQNSKGDELLQDSHWKALKRLEEIVRIRRKLEHDDISGKHGFNVELYKANKRKRGTYRS